MDEQGQLFNDDDYTQPPLSPLNKRRARNRPGKRAAALVPTFRTTSESLSKSQFMPITQLANMPAGDEFDDSEPNMEKVFTDFYRKRTQGAGGEWDDPYPWDDLRNDVAKNGIQQPISIARNAERNEDVIANGHHRAAMAMEQGHLFVPVQHEGDYDDYWEKQ